MVIDFFVFFVQCRSVPAFCCFLDENGEVADFLKLNHLLNRRVCPFPQEREEKVRKRMKKLLCVLLVLSSFHPGG